MAHPFSEYAQYYDLLYKDKPYKDEALFVAGLLEQCLAKSPPEIDLLDLACGTGRHAQEFAQLGFVVEGSDISADMIAIARERAQAEGLPLRYYIESFQSCNKIARRYDAVVAMFAAINYLTDHRDMSQSLSNIRGLLKPGGVFVFDFWNGNAVVKSYSPVRVKRAEEGDQCVLRTSNTTVDAKTQIASVRFDFLLMKASTVIREFSETHTIRYFFPEEMTDLLAANGFEVLFRRRFLSANRAPEAEDWNLTYVARPCA